MKVVVRSLVVVAILLLVACQSNPAAPVATDQPPAVPAATETAVPTAVPTATATAADAPDSTSTPEATAVAPTDATLPGPTLFDTTWDDRDIFRSGLVPSEQSLLDSQLPGAPVYHLALTLGQSPATITGQQELHYTNQETVALDETYFHLYPNLLGGEMDVSNVRVNGQAVEADDEGTVLRVPLDPPLPPGEQVVIAMDFVTRVPQELGRNYGIQAYVDDVLALAHFYPVVAIYDEAGWNIEPAPEQGDVTYADAAFYLLRLTAPAEQVVAASGVEIDRAADADTQTITFAGGPMRDFYMALSPDYDVVSTQVGDVVINSYARADLMDAAAQALDIAAFALQSFSERYGPYPYTEFDMVTTPTLALGIEYPGIIANTVRMYEPGNNFRTPNEILLESTTAHEVAHQWFYNLIGNDQLDEPWLDESVTQHATYQYYVDRYGPLAGDSFYDTFELRWSVVEEEPIPIGQPVEIYDGNAYSAIIYGRGPIFVGELAETMGQEAFDRFIRAYADQFRWGITNTEDFRLLAEQECDCDLSPLFDEWIYAN